MSDANIARICLAQIGTDPLSAELGRESTVRAAEAGFEQGADIVVLPELSVPGYSVDRQVLEPRAETLGGPTVQAWTSVASTSGGYIVGGFCERDGEDLYNSVVLVGEGGVLLHYRKLHLFAEEKLALTPGNLGLPTVETRFGLIGVCVCYDLRFVEVVRALALQGADLICVPTAWIAGFDQRRWDERGMCPQAHGAVLQANLSQVFIAAASQVGRRGEFEYLGSSVLADPYGNLAAGPLSGTADEISVTEIDLTSARRARQRGPLITPREDRRTDVYGVLLGKDVL